MKKVIAIDGTAASGKGTLARRLAALYGFPHLDTGLLYRYVGVEAQRRGIDLDDAAAASALALKLARDLDTSILADPSYRAPEAGPAASRVSLHPGVRRALLDLQHDFIARAPEGAVLDGRDIGTVICPGAALKFFVTARTEIRAERRWKELRAGGMPADYDAILADMLERDRRDAEREAAPMRPALDAILIDTSDMNIEDVVASAKGHTDRLFASF